MRKVTNSVFRILNSTCIHENVVNIDKLRVSVNAEDKGWNVSNREVLLNAMPVNELVRRRERKEIS